MGLEETLRQLGKEIQSDPRFAALKAAAAKNDADESLQKQMSELHHQFFIIYADGVPSGYLSIETVEKDLYEFQKIYSLPSLHGSGIGRFIIEQGIAYLKTIHPSPFTIELNVNRHNPAVGFYKHMGFHEHATRDFHIGNGYYMNDYIMRMEVKE